MRKQIPRASSKIQNGKFTIKLQNQRLKYMKQTKHSATILKSFKFEFSVSILNRNIFFEYNLNFALNWFVRNSVFLKIKKIVYEKF